ncbi:uncharacterized protein LOC128389920 [Panonychus citri]|uniref:uncharacterized protein LOC128389920 n=1 Tax=Panonychus citri TaxID=50023 RepID=UPI0023076B64|nr:uncharacterized protein LOC128389920 [Panonychus citri]
MMLIVALDSRTTLKYNESTLEPQLTLNLPMLLFISIEIYTFIIFHFYFTKQFISTINDQWIKLTEGQQIVNCLLRKRKVYETIIIINAVFALAIDAVSYSIYYTDYDYYLIVFDYNSTTINSTRTSHIGLVFYIRIIRRLILIGNFFLNELIIVDCSLIAQTVYHFINIQISSIDKHLYDHNLLDHIRAIRLKFNQCYDLVTKLRILMDPCLLGVFIQYTHFLAKNIYNCIFEYHNLSLKMLQFNFITDTILSFSTIICMTYPIVETHCVSVQSYSKIYSLSFHDKISKSFELLNEVTLFANRIDRKDLGFSCGGFFMITPEFITSVVTIIFTIVIATPSFAN